MKKIAFILIISFVSTISFAQLKVVNTGKVGINIGTNTPVSNLSINSVGNSDASLFVEGNRKTIWAECTGIDSPMSSWIFSVIGITPVKDIRYSAGLIGQSFATSSTGGRAYGVIGVAGNSTTGYNYGVFGTTYGTQDGAGVIGTTGYDLDVEISGLYAGYFDGDVKVTGLINGVTVPCSDRRLKQNIAELETAILASKGVSTLNTIIQMKL